MVPDRMTLNVNGTFGVRINVKLFDHKNRQQSCPERKASADEQCVMKAMHLCLRQQMRWFTVRMR